MSKSGLKDGTSFTPRIRAATAAFERAHLASLIHADGAAVAVIITPLMRKRIGRVQLVARREEEEGSAGAVRDGKLAQERDGDSHYVFIPIPS